MTLRTVEGAVVRLDREDWLRLRHYRWELDRYGYVRRRIWTKARRGASVSMHGQILGKIRGRECDHRNRCKLDNTRANLHNVTHRTNCRNRGEKS